MLVLVLGDFYIPHKAIDIDPKFKKLLVPGKIQQILTTGNVSWPVLDYLHTIAPDVTRVCGYWDHSGKDLAILEIASFRIVLIAGHEIVPWGDKGILASLARKWDADVLISGFTCKFEAEEIDDRFFINPGSATGVDGDGIPSFVLMDVQNNTLVLYIYRIIDDKVKVEKMEYVKKDGNKGN